MAKANHYVDNEKFLNDLLHYENLRNTSLNPELIQPTDYVSKSIIKICTKLLDSPTFMKQNVDRDSLISEAIFDCVKALKNFDSKKSKNPFGYFTQIAYYAFLKILIKEQKIFKNKCKMIQSNAFTCMDIVAELSGKSVSNDPNVEATVNQLQIYLDFDIAASEVKKKKATRAPLYLQNRKKIDPKDEVVEVVKPETLLEALNKNKK
ncbi:MAG: hypothetical protein QM489_00830 [Candidatus Izemoplasma sp.]